MAKDEIVNTPNELVDLPPEFEQDFDSPAVEYNFENSSRDNAEVICQDKKLEDIAAVKAAKVDLEMDGSFTLRDDRDQLKEMLSPANVTEGEENRAMQSANAAQISAAATVIRDDSPAEHPHNSMTELMGSNKKRESDNTEPQYMEASSFYQNTQGLSEIEDEALADTIKQF